MTHEVDADVASASSPMVAVDMRAAHYLNVHHGDNALAEAVRHGMAAQRRGDPAAARFWCSVCSALVQMRQAGETAGI